jgi:hypothetical protein
MSRYALYHARFSAEQLWPGWYAVVERRTSAIVLSGFSSYEAAWSWIVKSSSLDHLVNAVDKPPRHVTQVLSENFHFSFRVGADSDVTDATP